MAGIKAHPAQIGGHCERSEAISFRLPNQGFAYLSECRHTLQWQRHPLCPRKKFHTGSPGEPHGAENERKESKS